MSSTVPATRVVVADPRRLIGDVLSEALQSFPDIEVVARTDDEPTTVLQATRTGAEVVVVPAACSWPLLDLCEQLRGCASPRPRTLVLDHRPDEDALLHAVESGADGYTTGGAGLAAVADAVRAIARGESVVPPAMLGPLLRRLIQRRREADRSAERFGELTRREREVFALLVEGLDHKQIAARLVISPETARTHVQRVLRKLEVRSRVEAVALAARSGIADRLERALERSAS